MDDSLSTLKADLEHRLRLVGEVELLRAQLAEKEKELGLLQESEGPSPSPRLRPMSKVTQAEWVRFFLATKGPQSRESLFKLLEQTDKRPGSLEQLSAILSKEKKEGRIQRDPESGDWLVTPVVGTKDEDFC